MRLQPVREMKMIKLFNHTIAKKPDKLMVNLFTHVAHLGFVMNKRAKSQVQQIFKRSQRIKQLKSSKFTYL